VHGSYISSSYGGGLRGSTVYVEWSDNNSSWTTAWSGVITNNTNGCGIIRTGTSSYDSLFAYGAGTMKYVGATNVPDWGTDQDPPGYTLSLDVSSNGSYLYSKTYTDDTRGRCTHVGDGWVFPSDHNYTNGIVGYNAAYNSETASTSGAKKGYSNISIVRNDPVEIIQEFVIPGRIEGPIIQKLGMKTARTISINIDGASPDNKQCVKFCESTFDPCDSLPTFSIKDFEKLIEENASWVKTKEDYTSNKLDGSYSISLEYTCIG
jgi:hypothetical protein